MPENHFLIGLGGTGGLILRAFRKTVYKNFHDGQPDGVRIGYLYVDSDDSMMALDDPSWKILGTNVQLPQKSQLKIAGIDVETVLDDPADYHGISPWLGDRDLFRDIIRSADASKVVGGQKRRLGRFLFACKHREYAERLRAIVRELTVGNINTVTFHFVLGLAGGTGSGSIIDAVCQARQLFNSPNYRIMIYALLPEKQPADNRGGPNFHANGYAALRELNALDVGAYQPIDIAGTASARLDLKDPFNLCYLFTDENEDGNRVDVDVELPEIVASFLFQKIVTAGEIVWPANGDPLKRQERFELGAQAQAKETSPFTGTPERSRRFFAFGTKQIAYPQQEIHEYLSYSLALQAGLQLQFDNFSETFGYVGEAATRSYGEFVRTAERQQGWLLSNACLTLSAGILPDERANLRWKPIDRYWPELLPEYRELVMQQHAADPTRWLPELRRLFNQAYEQQYRGQGVEQFYRLKAGERGQYCREIRNALEGDLFGGWINGTMSLADVSAMMRALLDALGEKRLQLENERAQKNHRVTQAEGRIVAVATEAARMGPLGRLLGKRKRLFVSYGEALRDFYAAKTELRGLDFALSLLGDVVSELTLLANAVGAAGVIVGAGVESFRTSIDERLRGGDQNDTQSQVVFFYKPDDVKEFVRSLTVSEDLQKQQTAAVRQEISRRLGANHGFAQFNQRIGEQGFKDLVEAASEKNADNLHQALIAADSSRDRVLGVSVLGRLKKEFGGNRDALRGFLTTIVSKAKSQITFDMAEVNRGLPGNEPLGPMYSHTTVIVPAANDDGDFRDDVVRELRSALVGPGNVVTNPARPNEITILNVRSGFAARVVKDVAFLRDAYEARINAPDGKRAVFELHTEGDGSAWPSLYVRKRTRADVLPCLLAGRGLNHVLLLNDPMTGIEAFYLMGHDDAGRPLPPRPLGGDDLVAVADHIEPVDLDALETYVSATLATTYLHRDRRKEVYAVVSRMVADVVNGIENPLDAVRRSYEDALPRVEKILASGRC